MFPRAVLILHYCCWRSGNQNCAGVWSARRVMSRRRLLIGFLLALPPWAGAQTDQATRALIEKLLARIDSLETRVAQLERSGARAPAQAAPTTLAPTQTAPAQAVHAGHDTAPMPDLAQPAYPSLKLAGFSDFNFSATDLHGPSGGFGTQTLLGAHSGFQEGQFALHISSA